MEFAGLNIFAVGTALIASMVIGAIWYGIFAKLWMAAAGITPDELDQKPSLYAIAALCQLIMAFMLAGLIGHLDLVSLRGGILTGAFCWLGFVVTSITVNHRFQNASWSLTLINSGHWLVVLVAQGAIIGAIGV